MTNKTKKKKSKKFRQTRQLVRLALNSGWTQTDIGEKCRVSQSIVSAWSKGTTQGSEDQLKPLLELFGNKIRRKNFQVYYSYNSETNVYEYYKVEGTVVFSYTFKITENTSKKPKVVSVRKLIIHSQGNNKFLIANQNRPIFKDNINSKDVHLKCNYASGMWFSSIEIKESLDELLQYIDKYSSSIKDKFLDDSITLPYLVRKALLEKGFPVDEIVEYPAVW